MLFRSRYPILLDLFRISACHVYLTYPFVLSWSLIEAMSTGALVAASDTAPVREVIEDGSNGLLFDFFDEATLVDRVCEALARPDAFNSIRQRARATAVNRYDLRSICLPRQIALVNAVAAGRLPPGGQDFNRGR